MYWLKKLTPTHTYFLNILISLKKNEIEMPLWLITTKTSLLGPGKYRTIALLNSMYKVYTSILNYFLDDHCRVNNIIGIGQAAAKRGSWGCIDQLLISKAIMEEMASKRKKIVCYGLTIRKPSILYPMIS